MSHEQKAKEGFSAQKLMGDKTLISAFELIESDCLQSFSKLKHNEVEKMVEINMQIKSLALLKDKLEHVITTGKVSETMLEKLKNKVTQ